MRSGCKWEWMPWRLKPQPEWHSFLDWKSGSVSWQLKSPVESGGGLWNQSWFGWIFGVLQTWRRVFENFGALRCDLASLEILEFEESGENQYGILAYWYIGVLEIGTDRVSPHW